MATQITLAKLRESESKTNRQKHKKEICRGKNRWVGWTLKRVRTESNQYAFIKLCEIAKESNNNFWVAHRGKKKQGTRKGL